MKSIVMMNVRYLWVCRLEATATHDQIDYDDSTSVSNERFLLCKFLCLLSKLFFPRCFFFTQNSKSTHDSAAHSTRCRRARVWNKNDHKTYVILIFMYLFRSIKRQWTFLLPSHSISFVVAGLIYFFTTSYISFSPALLGTPFTWTLDQLGKTTRHNVRVTRIFFHIFF